MNIDMNAMAAAMKEKDRKESAMNTFVNVAQMAQVALRRAFPVSLVVITL